MLRIFFLSFFILTITFSVSAQRSVYFAETNAVSSDALLTTLKACTAKATDTKDPRILEYCLQKDVREHIWSEGFLNAKVGAAEKQEDGRFKVTMDEGMRYRLGDINIAGSTIFSTKQLLGKLDLTTGDVADGRKLSDFVFGKLKELYDEAGFIQSTAEFEPRFRVDPNSPADGIADIRITIDEGRQFAVRQITVVGNLHIRDRFVMDVMLTKPGDIFDRKKFDESINRLNQLGLFEVVRDDNFELNVDTESGDIDIVVKLVERKNLRSHPNKQPL